jgi:hypothetical protein
LILAPARTVASRLRRDGTAWLPAGSMVAGLAAYGFLLWGGRALGSEAFAPIATLWTVQYIVMATALFAIEQYVVRLTAVPGRAHHLREVTPMLWLTLIGIAVAVVLAEEVILGSWELALVGGSWVVTLGALTLARGIAGGRGWYRVAGIATGSESATRFLLALVAVTVLGTTMSLALTLPCGPVPFLVWWWLRHRDQTTDQRTSGPLGSSHDPPRTTIGATAAFLLTTAFANGSLQVLLGGGPLVLIGLGASAAQISAFFATTALARAPLLIAIGIVPRILNPLTRRAEAGEYAAVRELAWLVVAGTLATAALGGLAGYLVGPRIVGILYGGDFAISGLATGAAAAAVVVAMGALALNQVIVAEGRPRRLVPAWTLGLAAAAALIIAAPLDPLTRVSVAALTGQVAAILGLAGAITLVPAQPSADPGSTPP